MGVVDEVVARIPGVALAVDENLRVLACSPGTFQGLPLSTTDVRGRPCYEVASLVDAETGRPCRVHCPLARGNARPGWAYTRAVEVNGSRSLGEASGEAVESGSLGHRKDGLQVSGRDQNVRLDCLLLKYLTPGGRQSNLCCLELPRASNAETDTRVLRAIEALYPVVSGSADLKEVLAVSLRAALGTTSADGGEIFLLDPETRHLVLRECQGLPAKAMRAFRQSAIGPRFSGLIAGSSVPLLAVGEWPGDGRLSGTYLCAPLVAEGRVLGALGIASRQRDFDVASASRMLFPVAAQLGVYLRWAYLAGKNANGSHANGPPEEAARLRINCLGPFRVAVDGKPIPASRFQRFKSLTLLKFLVAHRGRAIPRETLMELLWPESDPARASGNLRVVLHALRRALEPGLRRGQASSFVVSQGDLVRLDSSSSVWVDGEEFVQKTRHAARLASLGRAEEAVAEYHRAASLYQGEYLEDEPYSDWCLFERERLKEVYINLITEMASILTAMGDVSHAIDAYRTALGVDRGREEVHRELMRLLWKAGRRDEALRQYETCRRILWEELEVGPAQETASLYRAMQEEIFVRV